MVRVALESRSINDQKVFILLDFRSVFIELFLYNQNTYCNNHIHPCHSKQWSLSFVHYFHIIWQLSLDGR